MNGVSGSGSSVKILLVEDEPPLLQLLGRYLQRLGYEVETHLTSSDALRNFEAEPGQYGIVIADLSMPDIPGHMMLSRMLEIRPDLRILVCSGTPFGIENLPDPLQDQVAFLQKPFIPKMLSEAVEKLLDHSSLDPPAATA